MRFIVCLSILTLVSSMLPAQQVDPFHQIRHIIDLFGTKNKGLWIQVYSGWSHKGERYALVLGHDLNAYKGILSRLEKKDSFLVEGAYHQGQFKLVIQDSTYEHVGFLLAEMYESGLKARWMDSGKETGLYIEFEKVPREGFAAPKCPSRNWYQSFSGIMEKEPVFVQLQSDIDQRVYGTLSVPQKLTGYILSGDCEDPKCKLMKLRMHDYFGERVKEFTIEKINEKQFKTEELFKQQIHITENWESVTKHSLVCKNMQLPGIKIYAQYLQLNDREFDQWINGFLDKWAEQVVSYYQNTPVENTKEFSAYMDIDWIHKDWVTGIFRFDEPWNEETRNLSFNYDRKSNRIISIDELFDKEFDYQKYFEDYLAWKKQEMMSVNTSGRFKLYVQTEGFKHWTLRPEGFCFSSDFNRVWGNRKIVIPYALLQDKIRKTGPLRKLY